MIRQEAISTGSKPWLWVTLFATSQFERVKSAAEVAGRKAEQVERAREAIATMELLQKEGPRGAKHRGLSTSN